MIVIEKRMKYLCEWHKICIRWRLMPQITWAEKKLWIKITSIWAAGGKKSTQSNFIQLSEFVRWIPFRISCCCCCCQTVFFFIPHLHLIHATAICRMHTNQPKTIWWHKNVDKKLTQKNPFWWKMACEIFYRVCFKSIKLKTTLNLMHYAFWAITCK